LVLQHIITRIQTEQSIKGAKPSPCILKGWNVIKLIVSNSTYMPKYYDEIE